MNTPAKWTLRTLPEAELDNLYESRIQADFPSAERPSAEALRRHMALGLQTIFILQKDGRDAAYVVCAESNGVVLVTLLAVYQDMRGGGVGSALLSQLQEKYMDRRGILLEVEAPVDAENAEDEKIRTRRIAFYERAGYHLLENVEHISFGIRLLPMALPLADSLSRLDATAAEDLAAVYRRILPERLWDRVSTRRLAP